jgi:hypothetical protein
MSSSHIPILLGSYNATLDLTDQLVLQVSLTVKKSYITEYLLNLNYHGSISLNTFYSILESLNCFFGDNGTDQ